MTSRALPGGGDLGELQRYWDAAARLDALIDPVGPADRSLAAIWARAEAKVERARAFLGYLGNPHHAYPIVHVTGTSGKGSTCAAISAIMTRAGYRAGLATSPFLQVATEKLQLGERLIGPDDFAALVDDMLAAAKRWRQRASLDRPLSYGEVWVALMLTWFARQRVDVAVVEVGAGGRFDVTNVVDPAVAVVTSVGLDHTATLGPTVEHIAWHKAGIFKPGAMAVTAATDPVALAELRREARTHGIPLTELHPERSLTIIESGPAGTRWRLAGDLGDLAAETYSSPQPGQFQAINGALALLAVRSLAAVGLDCPPRAVREGLAAARMPGRGEVMPTASGQPPVIIDAAHNPDKIRALVSSLPDVLPVEVGGSGRPVLLTGALAGKDAAAMLTHLLPEVAAVVTTAVGVTGKDPLPAADVATLVRGAGYAGAVTSAADPMQGLDLAIEQATAQGAPVLVTGSLFLAGRIRERWFPAAAILRQRTPWPIASNAGRGTR